MSAGAFPECSDRRAPHLVAEGERLAPGVEHEAGAEGIAQPVREEHFLVARAELLPIAVEEHRHREEGGALVAIDEGLSFREAMRQHRGQVCDVRVAEVLVPLMLDSSAWTIRRGPPWWTGRQALVDGPPRFGGSTSARIRAPCHPRSDLRSGCEPELGQDPFDVAVGGALGDHQPLGDLAI